VAPLTLIVLLLATQVAVLTSSVRKRVWRTVPGWVLYVFVITVHLTVGALSDVLKLDYPMRLLYFEPAIMVLQIAFTFESSLRYLGLPGRGRSPEATLLLWLIPLVPIAIVLPIEFGFVKEVLTGWESHEGQSLKLLYAIREFLALTLIVVLGLITFGTYINQRRPGPAAAFHHRLLIAYLGCLATGYLCKAHVKALADRQTTIAFFVVGPMICFAAWSWRMWNASPSDFEPFAVPSADPESGLSPYQRHQHAFQVPS